MGGVGVNLDFGKAMGGLDCRAQFFHRVYRNALVLTAVQAQHRRLQFGGDIKWNFTKFLVGREGQIVNRFAPTTTPEKLESDVQRQLEA